MATSSSRFATRLQQAWLTRGPLATSLLPLALMFGALTAARHWLYGRGILKAQHIDVPVLVVGNLVAGGAGKTPTVLALIALLRREGWQPGIVSRGHGRSADHVLEVGPDTPAASAGDEPLLLRLRGGAPVFVGRDRVAAARALRQRHPEVDIVVCDDGLQHLRLARDAQVLVFDERGAGNGWLLPAGPLREPVPDQVPARTAVLYNATRPSTPLPGHLAHRRLGGLVSIADWWQGRKSTPESMAGLRGRPLLAAAGIARPQRFFSMLREAGLDIVELPLPDHHDYVRFDWPPGTTDIVMTEKDAVKITPQRAGDVRLWVAALDFGFDADFERAVLALLPRRSAPPPLTRR
ncbi:tetraacyldisaccharide 4'-kinase [Piscinibacter sp.]|uniref:tetraacyldisaccharide 4'-kinase n=1 Tax=Piscinibacter sp. TaxID=1903157 RepID=UPI001B400803|nr:tetraacyldisaccharide 4'-kinase [Piscinibacter sp.]MBK7529829.1 tetraacyldisaccharide 4'-kinase [Piscinibacter sp.]MBP6542694.1 tetraacyldisaccharide 4'-kinase [Piscinibacter sp.]